MQRQVPSTPSQPLRSHAALERIVLFGLRLTCRTGLHIGAGKTVDLVASDLPVMRDAGGNPLVPGSSLRGVLRAGAESLLAGLGLPVASSRPEPTPEGSRPSLAEAWQRWSWIDRLFGRIGGKDDLSFASRLSISDLRSVTPAGEPVGVELRDGVGISRELRTAAENVKYDLEVVPAGTVFEGSARLKNPEDADVGLVAQTLWMLDEGLLALGGKSARGLGWMGVAVTAPVEHTAADILARRAPAPEGDGFGSVGERFSRYLDSLSQAIAGKEV